MKNMLTERERETSSNVLGRKNTNLNNAKRNKDDEFFTDYNDVAAELVKYKEQLRNKSILCPCDYDYDTLSREQKQILYEKKFIPEINDGFAFSRFLRAKQEEWNLDLHFSNYNIDTNEGKKFQESIPEFAKNYPDGVVITNPPFRLFTDFVDLLVENNLKFLVMGDKTAALYAPILKRVKLNQCWLGYSKPSNFLRKDGIVKNMNNKVRWFTNLDNEPRKRRYILTKEYDKNLYPFYDHHPQYINVNRVKDIPKDYFGIMGVPITFLDHYNPEQFEIIGKMNNTKIDGDIEYGYPYVNGKKVFGRLLIRRVKEND
ncbi:adenine-specific methyltransferase EcoRI family protein [Mycoplasma sp. 4044]